MINGRIKRAPSCIWLHSNSEGYGRNADVRWALIAHDLTNIRAFDRKSEVVAVTMRLYRLAAMMLVVEAEVAASRFAIYRGRSFTFRSIPCVIQLRENANESMR